MLLEKATAAFEVVVAVYCSGRRKVGMKKNQDKRCARKNEVTNVDRGLLPCLLRYYCRSFILLRQESKLEVKTFQEQASFEVMPSK